MHNFAILSTSQTCCGKADNRAAANLCTLINNPYTHLADILTFGQESKILVLCVFYLFYPFLCFRWDNLNLKRDEKLN